MIENILDWVNDIDLAVHLLINQQWRSVELDWLMPLLSSDTLLFIAIALCLLGVAITKGKPAFIVALKIVIIAVLAAACSDLACGVVKKTVGRVRPYQAIAGAYYQQDWQWQRNPDNFLQEKRSGSSFPSAHAANSAALCFALWLCLRSRLRVVYKFGLALLPLLVAWSRIYLGRHYLSDVIAGLAFGVFIALVTHAFLMCLSRLGFFNWLESRLFRSFLKKV